MFESMQDVKNANKALGQHFFSAETMRFFSSRIPTALIDGRFFVTSEKYLSPTGADAPRLYTAREATPNGDILTLGEFQQFETLAEALVFIGQVIAGKEVEV